MKRSFALLLCICMLLMLCSCGDKPAQSSEETPAPVSDGVITLSDGAVSSADPRVSISGKVATLTAGGEYTVSGELDGGQIVVDAAEDGARVLLHLSGVTMTNEEAPCIFVQQCDKLKLILDEGSENSLCSGVEGVSYEEPSGAVIYSEDDLDVEGSGKLTVNGFINNGITCKDDLAIQGGELTITAANNGLRGSESVEIEAGKLTIVAGGDGVKSTSAKKEGKGYISVSGGEISVEAGGDGIAAETQLLISGGTVSVTTTGEPELGSCKGLKGSTGVQISGGTFTLDTTDHCIRSGGDAEISGGSFSLKSSMGRGVSAWGTLRFSGEPSLVVDAIEDGLYSETELYIEGGSFNIAAGEDGIHAGQSGSGEGIVTVTGGSILVSAYQDGIDAKIALRIMGGDLLACGKYKTPKTASAESSQGSIFAELGGHAGSALTITDGSGTVIGSLNAVYPFTHVLFSRAGLGVCEFSCEGSSVSAQP